VYAGARGMQVQGVCSWGQLGVPHPCSFPPALPVQVLQADGSLLAVAVNAVCAALTDAGVPMNSMFGERGGGGSAGGGFVT
jgi:hypothetical protein